MAYEKQTWVNGDIITAEKLNHIENGIASGGGGSDWVVATFNVTVDNSGETSRKIWSCDKTYEEISSALTNSKKVVGYVNFTEENRYPMLTAVRKIDINDEEDPWHAIEFSSCSVGMDYDQMEDVMTYVYASVDDENEVRGIFMYRFLSDLINPNS